MFKASIPVLHMSSALVSEDFYKKLGFLRLFAHHGDPGKADPCYMGVARDGVHLHLSSFSGDGVAGGLAYFNVGNVHELHAEFVKNGIPVDSGPVDQSWGAREMHVKDPDHNSLRFIQHFKA